MIVTSGEAAEGPRREARFKASSNAILPMRADARALIRLIASATLVPSGAVKVLSSLTYYWLVACNVSYVDAASIHLGDGAYEILSVLPHND